MPPATQGQESKAPSVSIDVEEREETLYIESDEYEEERVLSSNADGSSLTLLEEYSIRESSHIKWQTAIAIACAAASLAFALMTYQSL